MIQIILHQKGFESESNGDNNKDNIGLIDIDSNRDKDDNKSDNNTLVDNKEEIDNKSEDKKENGDLIDKEEDKGKENLIDAGKKDDNDINKGDNKDDNNIGEIPSEDKKSTTMILTKEIIKMIIISVKYLQKTKKVMKY